MEQWKSGEDRRKQKWNNQVDRESEDGVVAGLRGSLAASTVADAAELTVFALSLMSNRNRGLETVAVGQNEI